VYVAPPDADVSQLHSESIYSGNYGRLAQLDRALVSGTRGRGFKSRIAYQIYSMGWEVFPSPLFFIVHQFPTFQP
jgi:hypothetical protein